MALKRDKRDKVFSDLIRTRDRWTCRRCRKQYQPPTQALHCSHFWGRRHKGTRWDELNAVALCYGCHSYLGGHPEEHRRWYREQIGEEKFALLETRARKVTKFTPADLEWLHQQMKARLKELAQPAEANISPAAGAGDTVRSDLPPVTRPRGRDDTGAT